MNFNKHFDNRTRQKYAILANSFNQIITYIITGDVMVLFLSDVLNFPIINITFILSIIPLISLIRLPLVIALKGTNKIKLIKISVIVKLFCTFQLLFIPSKEFDFIKYILLIIIYQISVEYGVGICWQPLMREITSQHDRGSFFSKMRFIFLILTVIFMALLSVFIGIKIMEYQYHFLIVIAIIGLFIQYYGIHRISKISEPKEINPNVIGNLSIIKNISENKVLIWPLIMDLVFVVIGFGLNVVYLKNVLGYSSKCISTYITFFNLSGTLLLPLIGKKIDSKIFNSFKQITFLYLIYIISILILPKYGMSFILNQIFIIIFAVMSGILSSYVYLLMTVLQHGMIKTEESSFVILNFYQMMVYIFNFIIINIFGVLISYVAKVPPVITNTLIYLDNFKLVNILLIIIGILVVNLIKDRIIFKMGIGSSDKSNL